MKASLFFIYGLLFSLFLSAQCPERNFLWHRIIFLRDSSNVDDDKQLHELLNYQGQIDQNHCLVDSANALLLQRIGWLFTKKNDFFTAVQYTKKSIALINENKNNPAINPALSIKSYWNLHLMYDSLKLEKKNTKALDSCITYGISLDAGYDYALGALQIIVPRLFYIGDYFRCIEYANLGESLTSKESVTAMEARENSFGYFFSWKINAFIYLNKTQEAGKILLETIRLGAANGKNNFMGALYTLYATVLTKQNKAIEAISYYEKSLYFNKKIGNPIGCAEALNNIGFTYSGSLHLYKMALPYYFKALKYADKNEALNILDNIANVYVQTGQYDSAFIFFQKAFNQLSDGFTEADLLKNNNAELQGNITEYITGMVLDKAAAYLSKYRATGDQKALEEAIKIYGITDRYFDKLKTSQAEIQSRLFWKTNNRRLYEQAIEACYLSRNSEKAFYFFEKSRSVLLNDQIMEQRRMDDVDIAKLAQLKQDEQEIRRRLRDAEPSTKEYLALQQQLFTVKQEQEKLIKHINDKHPSYQNNSDKALTLALVRKKILNNKRSLIEIFNGDSAVYVLSVTSGNASFNKLDKHLYDNLTNAYISFIAHPEMLNKDFTGFTNISHQLYKLIFSNIQLQAEESLIISPDGKGFPFEALILSVNNKEPDYLLNHYATSYTYSAKYLVNEFADNTTNRNSLLGVAPVKYGSSFGFAELQGSDISLQNIKSNFSDANNFVYEKATRSNFLQHFYDYQIIQLYTHAADSSSNNDPVIYFADSALYLSDLIPERKPVTQLVVLSACETANGKLYQGEGIFSFNRGFAALGIPAAISNLWSVDNESTYRITELFYKYLAKGLPTDIALQKAKIEFINNSSKEKTLPYFWAGPVLMGKVDVIKGTHGFSYTTLIWTSFILLGIIFVLYMIFSQKKRSRLGHTNTNKPVSI